MESTVIDDIDRRIIQALEIDGRLSIKDLGRQVGLSPNATGVRLNRILDGGIISGIHAKVDHERLGRGLEVSVDCWLAERGEVDWKRFERYVRDDPRVLEAVHITGKVDFRLRVAVASPAELDEFLRCLRIDACVAETDSRIILHSVKSATPTASTDSGNRLR